MGEWNIQKHNIDLKKYNLKNTFKTSQVYTDPASGSTRDTIYSICLELGTIDSLKNGILSYKNAIYIYKEKDDSYWIITSALAKHDLEKNTIEWEPGTMDTFNFKSESIIPNKTHSFLKLSFDVKQKQIVMKGIDSK